MHSDNVSPTDEAGRQTIPWERLVLQQLESLQRAGVTILPRLELPSQAGPSGSSASRSVTGPPGPSEAEPPQSPTSSQSLQSSKSPESSLSPDADVSPGSSPPASASSPSRPSPVRQENSSPEEQELSMSPTRRPPPPPSPSRKPTATTKSSVDSSEDRILGLQVLQEEVRQCTRCPELVASRTQTVFGVGNPHARLCLFGEAPGADEDRQGEPFVGKAGQLLTKILEACSLRREDVYILNTLRCRPPKNRNPLPEEIANCRPFFERQLELVQPEFICCLGAVAARALLETTTPVGKLRGKFHEFRGSKVLVTYHPAYLLRNPSMKRETWEDMKLLMREMGIPLPPAK